jgi:hypothetical protein
MRMLMARFQIKEDAIEAFTEARDKLLLALSQEKPKGIRYLWSALPDRASFVGLLELEDGVENPLPSMEAGKEFLNNLLGWVASPPVREEWKVVGIYQPRQ